MRVIITCGGFGHKTASGRFKLVFRGESVDLPEEEAMKLIADGNATIDAESAPVDVATPAGGQEVPVTGANTSGDGNGSSGQETGLFDEAKLLAMTNDELKKLGESMGADVAKCKKKADYVAAILVAQEADDGGEDEDPPDLSAEDPV